jgi:isoquinoline 1-oxidoreductase subunit beta
MTHHDMRISRRATLAGMAGLVIGVCLPTAVFAQSGAARAFRGGGAAAPFAPNAFVRVASDDTVTVLIKHIEFGQGPFTGLATLVAEEMDADWSKVRAEHAPSNVDLYKNLAFGAQGTGGSTAIANSYEQMRKAGATARAMLVAAAAAAWRVPAGEITVERGVLRHASGREGRFGEFAEAAARLAVPADVPLKDPSAFRLIGREGAVHRLDSASKANGRAQFTIDIREPGMLTVLVARPPRFGGKVASFDATATRSVAGVVDVKQIPTGVAVYAQGFWPASKGRDLLRVTWDESAAERRSSAQIVEEYRTHHRGGIRVPVPCACPRGAARRLPSMGWRACAGAARSGLAGKSPRPGMTMLSRVSPSTALPRRPEMPQHAAAQLGLLFGCPGSEAFAGLHAELALSDELFKIRRRARSRVDRGQHGAVNRQR